nr:O-antigen ligase family protein [Enterococcus faecalis]
MTLKITKLIYGLLLIMPVIESFNGYLIGYHISDVYRIILGVLIFVYLLTSGSKMNQASFQAMAVITVFLLLTFLQFLLLHGFQTVLKNDLKTVFRVMLLPLYVAYFKQSFSNKDLEKQDIVRLFTAYSVQFMLLVIFPFLFNTGLATYDLQTNSLTAKTGVGCKGFFIEVNSLVAILIAMMAYAGETSWKNFQSTQYVNCILYLVVSLGNAWALFIVSTKTGIVMAILYELFFIIRFVIMAKMLFKFRVIIAILFLMLAPFFVVLIKDFLGDFFIRTKYFYNLFGGDWVRFLTSSRSVYLSLTIKQISGSINELIIDLIGGGYYLSFFKPYEMYKRTVIEMDWFDFYFSYGLVGVFVYVSYLKNSIVSYLFFKHAECIKVIFTIFLVYSFFAGHIFFNSMTATILSMCIVYFEYNL